MTESVSLFSLFDAKRFIKRQLVNAEWEMRTPPSFISKGEFCFFNLQHLFPDIPTRSSIPRWRQKPTLLSTLSQLHFISPLPLYSLKLSYHRLSLARCPFKSVLVVSSLLSKCIQRCVVRSAGGAPCAVDERTVDYCARFAFFVKALVLIYICTLMRLHAEYYELASCRSCGSGISAYDLGLEIGTFRP